MANDTNAAGKGPPDYVLASHSDPSFSPSAASSSPSKLHVPLRSSSTSSSAAPAMDPPQAGTKRRWSPCTWRYAIEELQPLELGSRARSASIPRIKKPSAIGRHYNHRAARRYSPDGRRSPLYVDCSPRGEDSEEAEEGGNEDEDEDEEEAMEARVSRKAKAKRENGAGRQMSEQVCTRREGSPSELYFCHVCTPDRHLHV